MPGLSPGPTMRMPPKPMISQPPKPVVPPTVSEQASSTHPPIITPTARGSSLAQLAAISRARTLSGGSRTGDKHGVRGQGPSDVRGPAGPPHPHPAHRPEAPRRHSSQQFRHCKRSSSVLTAFPNRSLSAVSTNIPGGIRASGMNFQGYGSRFGSSAMGPLGKADPPRPPISMSQSSDRANWEILGVRREVQRESVPELRRSVRGSRTREALERMHPRASMERMCERPSVNPAERYVRLATQQSAQHLPERRFERSAQMERPVEHPSSARGHREQPDARHVDGAEAAYRRRLTAVPSGESPFKGRPRVPSIPRAQPPMNQPEMHQGDVGATVTLRQYQEFLNALTQESMKRDGAGPSTSGTTQASGEPRRARGTILLTPEKYKEFLDVVAGNGRHPRSVSATNTPLKRLSHVGAAASEAVIPYADEEPIVVATSYPPRSFSSRRSQSTHMRNVYDPRTKQVQEKAVVPAPRRDLVPASQSPRDLVPTARAQRELITTRTTTREVVPQRNVVPAVPQPPLGAPSPLFREVRNDIQALRMDMKDIKADVRGLRVDMSKLKDMMARGGGGARRNRLIAGTPVSLRGSPASLRRTEPSPRRHGGAATTASSHEKRHSYEATGVRCNKPSKRVMNAFVSLDVRASRDVGRKSRRKRKKRRKRRKHTRVDHHRPSHNHHEQEAPKPIERIIMPSVGQNQTVRRAGDEHYPIVTAVQTHQRLSEVHPAPTATQIPQKNETYPANASNGSAARRPSDENHPAAGGSVSSQRRPTEEMYPTTSPRPTFVGRQSTTSHSQVPTVRRLVDPTFIADRVASVKRKSILEDRASLKEEALASTGSTPPNSPNSVPVAPVDGEQRKSRDDSAIDDKKPSPIQMAELKKRFQKYAKTSTEQRWLNRLDQSLKSKKMADSTRNKFEDTLAG